MAIGAGSFMPSLSRADIAFTVGNASGFAGSTGDTVEVSLDNQNDKVRGIQVELRDGDNYLTVESCEITERSSDFDCVINELENGCGRYLVYSLSGSLIEKGTGPVCTIRYSVSENAPGGECRSIAPENIKISDEAGDPFPSSNVTSSPGEFCFKASGMCPAEAMYGEHSAETALLKSFRDDVVSKMPEGQELIKLYYGLSPIIVQMMEENREFKMQVKEMVDRVIGLIRKE
jgi:hypothetical protein